MNFPSQQTKMSSANSLNKFISWRSLSPKSQSQGLDDEKFAGTSSSDTYSTSLYADQFHASKIGSLRITIP